MNLHYSELASHYPRRIGLNDSTRLAMLHQLHLQYQPEYDFLLHYQALQKEVGFLKQRLRKRPQLVSFLSKTITDLYADAKHCFAQEIDNADVLQQLPARCPYLTLEHLFYAVEDLEVEGTEPVAA